MKNKRQGQAVLEYLLIFAFMSVILVTLVNAFNKFLGDSVQGLNYQLTQQLSTGVCKKCCFYSGYGNELNKSSVPQCY